jgi:hypothetical protein
VDREGMSGYVQGNRVVARVARVACAAVAALASTVSAHAATPTTADLVPPTPPPALGTVTTAAIRREGTIAIDGRLDEPGWGKAPVSSQFWQRFPDEGKPPEHPTEFRVMYDDHALYVGVRAHDREPARIKRLLTRRDESSSSDWITVSVDSYYDRRTAFVFALNAANVQRDWLLFDDLMEDPSWDAVWTAHAKVDDGGWCAEFRIPLSQLRFSGAPEQRWGLQIGRVVGRTGEEDFWAPMPRGENRIVSLFGTVDGLRGVDAGRRLELLPYVSGGASLGTIDDDDPFDHSISGRGGIGVDVRYGLGSAFTLAASINPDFGQVEADPSQVNLGAQELFFPEKRPFFLEGFDIFQFGIGTGDDAVETMFYTRRIGAPPHGDPDNDYIDAPDSTTIYAAAKVSGKARGWSVGLLDAVTGQESAEVELGGERSDVIVEPLTNFAVLRVMRDFRDGNTQVGALATAVNRSLDGTGLHGVLHDQGYTGGLQLKHRFGKRAWNFNAKVTGTWVHGDPAVIYEDQLEIRHLYQRPDANYVELDPTRTTLAGYGISTELGRNGATKHYRWAVGNDVRSPGFEANDIGFQTGADNIFPWAWGQYHEDKAGDHIANWVANINLWAWSDFEPQWDGYGGNVNGSMTLKNRWFFNAGIGYERTLWDLALLRGGPQIRGNHNLNTWANINTDTKRNVYASLSFSNWYQPVSSSTRTALDLGLNVQARPNVGLYLGPSVFLVTDDNQYVDEVADEMDVPQYVFARLHEVVVGLTVRGSWTFSPNLSLQLYAQPFIAAGDYRKYKVVSDPYAEAYADRFHELTPDEIRIDRDDEVAYVDRNRDGATDFAFDLDDFNFRQLRSNAVLRWEYRPGSTAFLIWSHGQTDEVSDGRFGTGGLSRGLTGLFSAPSEDIVMIKVNYWLGL